MKMMMWKLRGVNGNVRIARWRLESRESLPSWKILGAGRSCQAGKCWEQGEAAWLEEAEGEGKAAGLVKGDAVKLEDAVDDEVKIVRWT